MRNPTLFEMEKLEDAAKPRKRANGRAPFLSARHSPRDFGFHRSGLGRFVLPTGMQSRDFLSYYATQFATVEVDSTFYGCPSARTVNNWAARTPEDFIFSVKIPQVITHDKVLADCDSEFEEFVKTMDILGPKLGPMVFQFPAFDRWKFPKQESFLAVLIPFLKKLPADHEFVIEIRNKTWLDAKLRTCSGSTTSPWHSPTHRLCLDLGR